MGIETAMHVTGLPECCQAMAGILPSEFEFPDHVCDITACRSCENWAASCLQPEIPSSGSIFIEPQLPLGSSGRFVNCGPVEVPSQGPLLFDSSSWPYPLCDLGSSNDQLYAVIR